MGISPASSRAGHDVIRTPDQRLRVFVSSTLQELGPERAAVRAAIRRLRLSPVMFELGARPHPPRQVSRRAADIFTKGLTESRRSSDRFIILISLYDLALSRRAQGDLAGAADLLKEGLSLAAGAGDDASVAYYLTRLAEVAGRQDSPERAVRLRAAADVLLQGTGSGWLLAYVPPASPADELFGELRSSLGETAFAQAQAEGGEMEGSRAVKYALEEEQPAANPGP